MRSVHAWLAAGVILVCGWFAPNPATAEFALRDGDTVVFLGDSITAERGYGKVVENYALLRYPQRKVRFINAVGAVTLRQAGSNASIATCSPVGPPCSPWPTASTTSAGA